MSDMGRTRLSELPWTAAAFLADHPRTDGQLLSDD